MVHITQEVHMICLKGYMNIKKAAIKKHIHILAVL
mgnify:CR=1 FL=1